MKTNVYSVDDVVKSTNFIVNEMTKFAGYDNLPFLLHDTSAGVCTQLKSVLSIKCGLKLDSLVLENVLNYAISAEKSSPSAFSLTIKIINNLLKSRLRGTEEFNYVKYLSDALTQGVPSPTSKDVEALSSRFLDNDVISLRELFMSAVDLAGADGTVIIERAPSREMIELVTGYVFNLSPMINVTAKFIDVRVLLIDGFIESVSEIHSLLEQAAQSKEPLLLFVRGMSTDVQHTLAVNYTRGSLRVVPIIVPFDVEGINTLKDIAIVSRGDVVSSNKGDVISLVKFESAARIEKATVYGDKVILTNDKSTADVDIHVKALKKMREDRSINQIEDLYNKRIRSLSPRHVIVRLKNDMEFIRRSQALDYAFRGVKSLRDHGMIEFNTPVSAGKELTLTARAAVKYATSFVEMIDGVGAAITASR